MDRNSSNFVSFETWGLTGPGQLDASRRTRSLDVASAIRRFNELAVPGIGNVWFAKSLLWAVTGISVAKATRRKNIEVANAIEALSCWYTLQRNGGERDPRVRGVTKLPGRQNLAFEVVRKPGFYVTQPFRQGTVEALLALGLIEAAFTRRFNSFALSRLGNQFLEAAFENYRPNHTSVCRTLQDWVTGGDIPGAFTKLGEALDATDPLSQTAREILRNALVLGTEESAARRRSAIAWVRRVRRENKVSFSWSRRPPEIQDDHWQDLRVGAAFFAVRNGAINVLNALEAQIRRRREQWFSLKEPVSAPVARAIADLGALAKEFLDAQHDPSAEGTATRLCKECIEPSHIRVLESLVKRDQRVLQLRDSAIIVPGPAFVRSLHHDGSAVEPAEDAGPEGPSPQDQTWPSNISHRVTNLYFLDADLDGELDRTLLGADR